MWRRSLQYVRRRPFTGDRRPLAHFFSTTTTTPIRTVDTPPVRDVTVVEVGPRDGLQNEKSSILSVEQRFELVDRLVQAGCPKIEVGSFVSPQWVPAMAQSDQVYAQISAQRKAPDSRYNNTIFSCLVPNARGLEEAQRCQVDEIAIFASASEAFSQKNINCSIEESLERYRSIVQQATNASLPVRAYLSCVVACPYEGRIDPGVVTRYTEQLLDMGCYEVSLGDTIGVATPNTTRDLLEEVTNDIPASQLAVHFHDTYGQAVANTLVALEQFDIRTVDAAVAGLGGCLYAPGAAGNLATEDLVYLLDGLGLTTGISMDGLVDAAEYVTQILGRPSSSKAGVAHAARKP